MPFQNSMKLAKAGRWQDSCIELVRTAVSNPVLWTVAILEIDRLLRHHAGSDAHFAFSRNGFSPRTHLWSRSIGWALPGDLFDQPSYVPSNAIWKSHALEAEKGLVDSLMWAFTHAAGPEIDALDLLLARKFAPREQLWLRWMNRYLASSAAQIELGDQGAAHRFLRLAFHGVCRPVQQGPLVSVIMPVFNAESTLRFAATSILRQSWQPLELILIDDASTDGSAEICRRLAATDSRVKVHRNQVNVGPYVSKNVALTYAAGEYITCHDADDWAFPYRIEHQVNVLMRRKDGPKATTGRLIRLTLAGLPDRPCHVGHLSEDGFARKCFVSLMVARDHFDRHLGAWDNVRVSADGELMERAFRSPGGVLDDSRLVMLGLDNESGLTRDASLGIGDFGSDSPRATYERHWRRAHDALATRSLRFPAFPSSRPFEAHPAIEVPKARLTDAYQAVGVKESHAEAAELQNPEQRLEAHLRSPSSERALKKPNPNHVLSLAHEMVPHVGHEAALLFADSHLQGPSRHAMHVLLANAALHRGDSGGWLTQLNRYLQRFELAPVRLREGDSLLAKLATDPLPTVESGPLVTIIMPAWNAEATVKHAAQSVLDQTWRNIELFIIDDASTDGTWQALCNLQKQDDRVRIFRNRRNVGPYVSKNIALMSANGDFVTGHDADDWAHPQRIEQHADFLIAAGGAIRASVAYMLRMTPDGCFDFISKVNDFSMDGAARKALISCMYHRQDLTERLGFWDCVRFAADSEMISRAQCLFGEGFKTFSSIGMLCLDHPEGLTNDSLHGIRANNGGMSESRIAYRDSWKAVHQAGLSPGAAYMPFPQLDRRYPLIPGVAVSYDDQVANMAENFLSFRLMIP
jgi:glycosyltransferase involved in cell wall biosynthesis